MSGFYWKLGRIVRAGPPYLPADLALEQLVKYGPLGAQLRYVSGPRDTDPTGFELFVPYGFKPEDRRKQLLEMSRPTPWERVHLFDPEPKPAQPNLSACEQPGALPGRQRPRA